MSDAERSKWNARYREQAQPVREPSSFLVSLDSVLPRRGRALDVAGGTGRNALWLARRGLEVTLADISEVALGLARAEAEREGIALRTALVDFDTDPLPAGPWDVIACFHYLHRPLYPQFAAALAPGGLLVVVHPTRSNLQRNPKPGADFLLEDGELPGRVSGLGIVQYDEGWTEEGRHEARLVARKPQEASSWR